MKTLRLFAQLSKIDEAKREVWGVATAEMVDKEGEIFDYDTSKPYFKAWSDEISKATEGKSLGNVREMHEPSAVGKLIDLTFADSEKAIQVGAKIIDDTAWQKCKEGVYTGFSIGGQYVKAWKDGEFIRFTANPAEISVVDNPCVPGAHFTAIKADGTVQVRKFASAIRKDLGSVSNLAYILQSACYIQLDTAYEAEYEADGSQIPDELKAWVKEGAAILARMTQEELDELVGNMKAVDDKLGKAGAKHSAETKKHHAAIRKSLDGMSKAMDKMAGCYKDADDHMDALMGKDDMEESAPVVVTKKVPAAVEPKIETQESNMSLEKAEIEKLEKANADSASALSKVAEVEKSVGGLKEEVTKGFESIGTTLKAIAEAMVKQAGGDPSQKVARAAVPAASVTVTKTQENSEAVTDVDLSKMTPDQRFHHLAKQSLQNPLPDKTMPGYARV